MKNFNKNKSLNLAFLGLWFSSLSFTASSQSIMDIQTNHGVITVQLTDELTPVTVANFLAYASEGFYENTVFHRVVKNALIQGGGYNADLEIQAVHAPIILETNVGLSNVRGTIAMARRSDPDTASSQFFINTQDNLSLDYQSFSSPGYAVFGEVIDGMDVVDAISAQETINAAVTDLDGESFVIGNVPQNPVLIEVVRPREGQLIFDPMQATYTAGETIEVSLTETMEREAPLDFWVAVLTDEGTLLFVTETGFSLMPSAFMTAVPVDKISHPVFNLSVPQGLTGQFSLFAIFNDPGAGIDDLNHSLRSNIAQVSVELTP